MKLSNQAIKVLRILQNENSVTVSEFEKKGFDQSMVNRAALELNKKELVYLEEEEEFKQELTELGEKVKQEGSPEYRLMKQAEGGEKEISEIKSVDVDVALGKAREKDWLEIVQGKLKLKDEGKEVLETGDPVKSRLKKGEYSYQDEERGLVEKRKEAEVVIEITEKGQKVDLDQVKEEFNVEAQVSTPRIGRKHYYKQIIEEARQTWIEMGFSEMSGDYVVSSFLNFDALYTPQDHPAREMHDTFFMDEPARTNLVKFSDKVKRIQDTHEYGWETGSKGYGGEWDKHEAERNVLRTHTTAVSAQKLHEIDIDEEELPKKYFNVAKNFRNETVDRTHLAELMQTDGIVVGKNLNFKNLKGYISEFFKKMGYDEFRLIPSYYPYTEMSVEVQVWDEEDQEWLGMGGAGMFRPEVTKPLLGFEATVLAWGLGIDRIAMGAAELTDIRELYRNNIKIIENTPIWRKQ